MRKINLQKHVIITYDSIEELPITRFHKYNKMLLVDAGIGSSISDFDTHLSKLMAQMQTKDYKSVTIEIFNMRQNLYFILEDINPRQLAFAVLIKEIDGVACDDISDSGLSETLLKINDITIGELENELSEIKTKIDAELRYAFPSTFETATDKEYYDLLKKRTLLQLQEIKQGRTLELQAKINDINNQILTFTKPQNFQGADNAETQHDKQFEKMCLVIAQNIHTQAKKYNVFEFYNAYEFIKEQTKRNKSQK